MMSLVNGRAHVAVTLLLLLLNIYLINNCGEFLSTTGSGKGPNRSTRAGGTTPAAKNSRLVPHPLSSNGVGTKDNTHADATNDDEDPHGGSDSSGAATSENGRPSLPNDVVSSTSNTESSLQQNATSVHNKMGPRRRGDPDTNIYKRLDDNGGHGFLESVGDPAYVPPPKEHPSVFEFCPPSDRIVSMYLKGTGYGLTNQLLAYAGLFAFAVRSNRTVLIPKARVPMQMIVDLPNSYFAQGLRICHKFLPKRAKRIKFFQMKEVLARLRCPGKQCFQYADRMAVSKKPIKVMQLLDKLISLTDDWNLQYLSMWEMFLRYPYSGEVNAAVLPNSFICGLSFPNTTLGPFTTATAGLQKKCTNGEYVAVHIRLELDAVSMLKDRKIPTPQNVYDFLATTMANFAKSQGVTCVLICAGDMAPEYEKIIQKATDDTGILFSRKTTFLKEGAIVADPSAGGGVFYGKHVPTSSSVGATVDMMLMEKAKAVMVTAFSSFTLSVYSRRCGGLGCTNNSNVFIYDVYLDGSFTDAKPYPCNHTLGMFLKGPPHLIKDPPPEYAFFERRFDFNFESPLFTNRSKNENRKPRVGIDEPHFYSATNASTAAVASAGVQTTTSSTNNNTSSGNKDSEARGKKNLGEI